MLNNAGLSTDQGYAWERDVLVSCQAVQPPYLSSTGAPVTACLSSCWVKDVARVMMWTMASGQCSNTLWGKNTPSARLGASQKGCLVLAGLMGVKTATVVMPPRERYSNFWPQRKSLIAKLKHNFGICILALLIQKSKWIQWKQRNFHLWLLKVL